MQTVVYKIKLEKMFKFSILDRQTHTYIPPGFDGIFQISIVLYKCSSVKSDKENLGKIRLAKTPDK